MTKKPKRDAGLRLVLDAMRNPNDHKCHGVSQLSRALGISFTAVYRWHSVPLGRILEVERVSGIKRQTINPELFGAPRARPESGARADAA